MTVDKIYKVNDNLAIIYYIDRTPIRISTDSGTALLMALAFVSPIFHRLTLLEMSAAICGEDTCPSFKVPDAA